MVPAADEAGDAAGAERLVVNMGPQHPSTHGVLRLILTLDGETVTELRPVIGYLHTGIEKNMEFRTWTQGVTFCTRMDYLSPIFNETAYCLAVERLLGIEEKIPQRASMLRVLMMELNRISSHMMAIGTFGLELGATTVLLYGLREREKVLDMFELVTGLRMNHAYIRPGGVSQDLPHGALEKIREFLRVMPPLIGELRKLLDANPLYLARTRNIAYLDLTGCMTLGVTGPMLRATGLPWDLRKSQPYCGYESYEFACRPRTPATPTAGISSGWTRWTNPSRSSSSARTGWPATAGRRPGHDRRCQGRLARPARAGPGRAGQLAGPHRAHHGAVHGGAHPSLQAGDRGLPGAGRAGVRDGGVAPRASLAAMRSATAARGRTGPISATRRSPTCSPCRRWPRAE